jgi:hypothetical protein
LWKKNKYEFLVLWKNSTVGNTIWVAEEHFPEGKKSYLTAFPVAHQKLFGENKGRKNKKSKEVV